MAEEVKPTLEERFETLDKNFKLLARSVRMIEAAYDNLLTKNSSEYNALQTEVHNFADLWTRRIENMESEVRPSDIRAEMAELLAAFVKESR
jgi:DUF438 domain-containing protein